MPFTICCGECRQCKWGNWSCCERTNPNDKMQAETYGYPLAGLFGFSHITGGFAGGQAEYLRVPYSDVGPIVIPEGLSDEQVLFLSDIFPTAYQAAEHCDIGPEDTVAIWGLRSSRCAGRQVVLPARRQARYRHRHRSRTSGAGTASRGGDHRFRYGERTRHDHGDDAWPGAGTR